MRFLKKLSYFHSTAITSFSLSIAPVILLFFGAFGNNDVLARERNLRVKAVNDDGEDQVCGMVVTEGGIPVTLREGVEISPEDFERLHVGKLQNAIFSPDSERRCAIQVCGFGSKGDIHDDDFIGSTSDYADCKVFQNHTSAPSEIFDNLYNLSSISCGCTKRTQDCTYSCIIRANRLNESWGDNDCAVLYQENACNTCFLEPVYVSKEQNYSTDVSHHIRSMVIRDKCHIKQFIPALRRMWLFANVSQPFNYVSEPTDFTVQSAFQSDPEYFYCSCKESPPTTTTPPLMTTVKPPPPPPPHDSFIPDGIGIIVGVLGISLALFTAVIIIWKRRDFCTRICSDDDSVIAQKRGSNESDLTFCTTISSSPSDLISTDGTLKLGDQRILSLPFDEAFDTYEDHIEMGQPLDAGHFGEVCRATLQVAIKRVKTSVGSEEKEISLKSLQQEIKILSYLGSHKNVVRLLGAHVGNLQNGELLLIIELCENGSLKSYLKSTVKPRVMANVSAHAMKGMTQALEKEDGYAEKSYIAINDDEENGEHADNLKELDPEMLTQMYQWMYQISCGMEFIQSKNIIHVDLASRNVLLNHKLVAKIGDFGLSKKAYIKDYVSSKKDSLPIRWVAPESLTDYKCSSKSDVWAMGITMWEIFNVGKDPYGDLTGLQVVTSLIVKQERLERPRFASEEDYLKMNECWKNEPEDRPSFGMLRQHFDMKLNSEVLKNEDLLETRNLSVDYS